MTPAEIQIAVAKEVGWSKIRMAIKGAGAPERKPSPHGFPPGRNYEAPVTNYPCDIKACMDICDRVTEEGWNCDCCNGLDKTWECWFIKSPDEHYGAGDTLPLAICEAFLRLRGKWKNTL